jgi:hypothetical protein
MVQAGADTVVSVVQVPHRFTPMASQIRDGWVYDFWREPLPFDRFRRQNLPVLYARNGPTSLQPRLR